jgi:tRNA(fMet)-specific endonuclease VapC
MRVLLDTSGYSALIRDHAGVADLVRAAEHVFLNPIVLAELQAGFLKGTKTRYNEQRLRRFLDQPGVGVVTIDAETAERHALIVDALRRAGRPCGTHDVWIAASAAQHGLHIVTCERDFLVFDHVRVEFFEPAR